MLQALWSLQAENDLLVYWVMGGLTYQIYKITGVKLTFTEGHTGKWETWHGNEKL